MRLAALPLLPLLWSVGSAHGGMYDSKEHPTDAGRFDLVLTGGRVIDPETGLDAIRDVGVRGDTIARVSTERLEGTRAIDASGLVVASGLHRPA